MYCNYIVPLSHLGLRLFSEGEDPQPSHDRYGAPARVMHSSSLTTHQQSWAEDGFIKPITLGGDQMPRVRDPYWACGQDTEEAPTLCL